MHFTVHKSDLIDNKINADLQYIINNILDISGNDIYSILLCGGFGRGEGSVEIRDDDIHIVNDYDFTIVLKERNHLHYLWLYNKVHRPLNKLAEELAQKLKIKQIDFAIKPLSYFTNSNYLKIENYEIKNGHYLLHGTDNPTLHMPNWDPKDIPLFEGTWLFRNRGLGLLIAALYFHCKGGIPETKKENFVIECNKAQLAMGDSILLLKGLYHNSYAERLNRAYKIDISNIPSGNKVMSNYIEALNHKLKPNFKPFYNRDLVKWWFEIASLFDSFYRYFEMTRLGVEFKDWIEYCKLYKPENRLDIRAVMGGLIKCKSKIFSINEIYSIFRKSKKSYSVSLMSLLLFSVQFDNYNHYYLKQASSLMKLKIKDDAKNNWLYLVRSFLHDIHPGGEVANAINLQFDHN